MPIFRGFVDADGNPLDIDHPILKPGYVGPAVNSAMQPLPLPWFCDPKKLAQVEAQIAAERAERESRMGD